MRAKIVIMVSGYPYANFWYQGPGGCRRISREIYKRYPGLDPDFTQFYLTDGKGMRRSVNCFLEPREDGQQ